MITHFDSIVSALQALSLSELDCYVEWGCLSVTECTFVLPKSVFY